MVSAGTIEHKMLGILSFKKGLFEGILDQGDSTIFMEESKFKVLMNTVESMMGDHTKPEAVPQNDFDLEIKQSEASPSSVDTSPQTQEPTVVQMQITFDGDDDVQQTTMEEEPKVENLPQQDSPDDLVQTGISFFRQLTETLSNPEATGKLISSIVQKDETDGKTYLKIPIENQKVVENAFALFAGLLGGLKK